MARYELNGQFFWTIEIAGATLKTQLGKIGSPAEISVKGYRTPTEANGEYDRLVLQKLGEGYVQVGEDANITLPASPRAKRSKAVTARPGTKAKKKKKS